MVIPGIYNSLGKLEGINFNLIPTFRSFIINIADKVTLRTIFSYVLNQIKLGYQNWVLLYCHKIVCFHRQEVQTI